MSKAEVKSRFHRFQNRGQIAAWETHLNRRWPYRHAMLRVVESLLAGMGEDGSPLHVVEFAGGPGLLAFHLLSHIPHLRYTGLDFSAPFIDYARRRLRRFGDRARLLHVDINEDAWPSRLDAPVDGFVALQAVHDLGGEDEIARVYRTSQALLAPRGLLINVDFVTPPHQPSATDPGRLSIARHFELLRQSGFAWADCVARQDSMACVVAGRHREPSAP